MQIKSNRIYRIAGYKKTITPTWRQKLLAMGMVPGTLIDVIRVAPMGDPVQIRTRRISLAIRQQDLAQILLRR